MSYGSQSMLAQDQDFINRCNACAAQELDPASKTNPLTYVYQNIWTLAAAPGFADAYESALVGGVGRPGWENAVISDAQILSAMQELISNVPPGPDF